MGRPKQTEGIAYEGLRSDRRYPVSVKLYVLVLFVALLAVALGVYSSVRTVRLRADLDAIRNSINEIDKGLMRDDLGSDTSLSIPSRLKRSRADDRGSNDLSDLNRKLKRLKLKVERVEATLEQLERHTATQVGFRVGYGMVGYGTVGYGMVGYVMVCYGKVGYGMVG